MFKKIEEAKEEIDKFKINTKEDLETFRLAYVGKKGVLRLLFESFKDIPNKDKKQYGQLLNELKEHASNKFFSSQEKLKSIDSKINNSADTVDLFLPIDNSTLGGVHPLTSIRQRFIEIFERMGFNLQDGPEIEDDFHNFSALNFPSNHPAREMQDTFFIEKNPDMLLRTHTSSVQIRLMQGQKPPYRSIIPGRVYRNEAVSARAHCFFNQIEGLYVDEKVSFKDMKDTLYHFAKEMYGSNTKIRLRPSYFPFTEPSAELDISCQICNQKGCPICKGSTWVEIGGCGMVDPKVFESCNVDAEKYTGFAFGMGIERIAMLKYQINDLRLFSENDIRFLTQF